MVWLVRGGTMFTRKNSLKIMKKEIKLSRKNNLPFFEIFLRWLDAKPNSPRCNLQNYEEFLEIMHLVWWGSRKTTFKSFEEFVEELCST